MAEAQRNILVELQPYFSYYCIINRVESVSLLILWFYSETLSLIEINKNGNNIFEKNIKNNYKIIKLLIK
jgi:hypothetical protein